MFELDETEVSDLITACRTSKLRSTAQWRQYLDAVVEKLATSIDLSEPECANLRMACLTSSARDDSEEWGWRLNMLAEKLLAECDALAFSKPGQ